MGQYDASLGTLTIGNWFNIGLYTFVLTEAWFYRMTFPNDAWPLRVIVAITIINDTVATAINCSMCYGYTVVDFNQPAGILLLGWEWVGLATCIAISSSICQSFLVWRLSKLVRVWWMLVPLLVLILTCFIVTLYGAYQFSVYRALDQRTYLGLLVTLWGAAEAAADIIINGVLVIYLLAQGRKSQFATTKRTVKRLALLALQSGALPSLCALLILILFRAVQTSNISGTFAMIIGRVYTITLLSNLNARNHGDRDSRHAATSVHTRSAIHFTQSVHFASTRPRKGGLDDIDLEGSHEWMVMAPRPLARFPTGDPVVPPTTASSIPTIVVQSATDGSLCEPERLAKVAQGDRSLPVLMSDQAAVEELKQ